MTGREADRIKLQDCGFRTGRSLDPFVRNIFQANKNERLSHLGVYNIYNLFGRDAVLVSDLTPEEQEEHKAAILDAMSVALVATSTASGGEDGSDGSEEESDSD